MDESPIVGRQREQAASARFLDDLTVGAAALIFEGDPGIGKTILWRAAVQAASERGYRVLVARPSESEAKLAFGSLADLVRGLPDELLQTLPEPQHKALEIALLRRKPTRAALDQRAVATGFLSTLGALARDGPVVVAVDDVQWLDRSSAAVIDFVIRRIEPHRIGILGSLRPAEEPSFTSRLEAAFGPASAQRLSLEPLNLAGIHDLLLQRLGVAFPRPMLVRIHDMSGGNPFFALEIGTALVRSGRRDATEGGLSVPESLRELITGRLTALPEPTRDMLLVAAAASTPTVGLITSTTEREPADLDSAIADGVVDVAGGTLRFAHPLIASTVYQAAPLARRREIHALLAKAVPDLEEKARHLALASIGPDEEVAGRLAEAARRAHARGAPDAAADLFQRAIALMPPQQREEIRDLSLEAADDLFDIGDHARAQGILDEIIREEVPGPRRAAALRRAAELCYTVHQFADAQSIYEQARDEVGDHPAERAQIELGLTLVANFLGEVGGMAEHVRLAESHAERAGDAGVLAQALAMSAMTDIYQGYGLDESRIERAEQLEDRERRPMVMARPGFLGAVCRALAGHPDEGYKRLCQVRQRMIDDGEESELPWVEMWTAGLAGYTGELAAAEQLVGALSARARILGADMPRAAALTASANLQAMRGDVSRVISEADEATALFMKNGIGFGLVWSLGALALAAASVGDWGLIDERCAPVTQLFLASGLREPMMAIQVLADHIEALIALGETERAALPLNWLEERGRATGRTWAIATGGRLRALLLASQGRLDEAATAAEEAVRTYEGVPLPVDRGRGLLVLGSIQRRRRQKAAARDALTAALELFEQIGVPRWADRARDELARLGVGAAGTGELTAAERRVAELAAAGSKTREIARELSMSSKTVEAHLTRIYAKLGVRSRTELASRMPSIQED